MPLFPGDSELQQLLHIFKLLGTPTEAEWAGVSKLRDWHEFPNWKKQDLSKHFPTLGADGIDLMELMFAYTPSQRITVRDHPRLLVLHALHILNYHHVFVRIIKTARSSGKHIISNATLPAHQSPRPSCPVACIAHAESFRKVQRSCNPIHCLGNPFRCSSVELCAPTSMLMVDGLCHRWVGDLAPKVPAVRLGPHSWQACLHYSQARQT